MDVINLKTALPDFLKMQQVQDQMFELISTWDGHVLTRVREQLDELRNLLLLVERSFKECVIGGIVLLEDRHFVPSTRTVDAPSKLGSVLTRLNQHHATLARFNLRLELYSLSALPESLAHLQSRATRLEEQAAGFDMRLVTLREQRAAVVQAIQVFERPSVASAFKGLIPSDEEIDQLMGLIKDPKVDAGLLKSVTAKLAKYADVLEGGRTFNDLSNAHARLQIKIDEAANDLQLAQRALQDANTELQAVTELSGLEALKQTWLGELRKVEVHWQAQAEKLTAGMAVEAATLALHDLCDYLKAVQQAYDRS
ncbi:alpha-xenorhabdolysin family binary toxin subunit B [Pseudomonas sp. NBRC 111119]|uniref:alpha-xenorhabdolysin family binary toxin subunit B n=1 Tax=Pseudomonas sp. NBRC 111119 TaxID=1661034 RepID=UPI000761B499|nr:alpha-xenorhabdolysin family binary toxin subunit B [Pseudomonas sp. NBRC 111119]